MPNSLDMVKVSSITPVSLKMLETLEEDLDAEAVKLPDGRRKFIFIYVRENHFFGKSFVQVRVFSKMTQPFSKDKIELSSHGNRKPIQYYELHGVEKHAWPI